jgi:hypothetical protein
VKTQKERIFKKVEEYKAWIKKARLKMTGGEIAKKTVSKLRGHYNYFGYKCNRSHLNYFYSQIMEVTYKWLNRRSQKRSYSRDSFKSLIEMIVPKPPTMELLKPLGVRYAR